MTSLLDQVEDAIRELSKQYPDSSPECGWLKNLQHEIAGHPPPRVHELKCVEPHFRNILTGRKRFELRLNDRDYRVGDRLRLYSWAPFLSEDVWKKRSRLSRIECSVDCIVTEHMEPGHVCMGIQVVDVTAVVDVTGSDERARYLENQVKQLTELVEGYSKDEPPIVKGALDAQADAERRLFALREEMDMLCREFRVAPGQTLRDRLHELGVL